MAESSSTTEKALAEVLAEVLGVEQVPVDGNFFDDLGADSMVMARFCARVRKRPDLRPVSMKDVYQHPSVRSLSDAVAVLPAAVLPPPAPTGLESAFAAVLAEVLGVERVPVDGHAFDDLGADSMVLARFCARVRKRSDLPPVSMKDVYQHPTMRSLARAVGGEAPAQESAPAQGKAPDPSPAPSWLPASPVVVVTPAERSVPGTPTVHETPVRPAGRHEGVRALWRPAVSRVRRVRLLQLFPGDEGLRVDLGRARPRRHVPALGGRRRWPLRRRLRPADRRQVGAHRALETPGDPHLEPGLRPVLAGRDPRPQQLPGQPDGRFADPSAVPAGAGGTRRPRRRHHVPVGPGVHGPADDRRRDGDPQELPPVGVPGTRRMDPDRGGHPGQGRRGRRVHSDRHRDVDRRRRTARPLVVAAPRPGGAGRRALARVPCAADRRRLRTVGPARCGRVRRGVYRLVQLAKVVGIYVPLAVGFFDVLLTEGPTLAGKAMSGVLALLTWRFPTGLALAVSFVVVFVGVLVLLALSFTLPRALAVAVRPDRVYPLYGFRYGLTS